MSIPAALLTADSLAATLDIIPGREALGLNGDTRAELISEQIVGLQAMPESTQMARYCEYAAKYLPQTIQKWKDGEVCLDQTAMFAAPLLRNEICDIPYFMRLAILPHNQDWVTMQFTRTLAAANVMDTMPEEGVERILQYLSTLLVIQGADNVPNEEKTAMIARLRIWQGRFPHVHSAERCLGMLSALPFPDSIIPTASIMRDRLLKGVHSCAICLSVKGVDGGTLLRCAKCRSTVYCGQEHQRAHWRQHKPQCFRVNFSCTLWRGI